MKDITTEMTPLEIREAICMAIPAAINELIKIARSPIFTENGGVIDEHGDSVGMSLDDLSADKLANAAKAKKMSIVDATELAKIYESETTAINALKSGKAEDNLDNPMASRIKK